MFALIYFVVNCLSKISRKCDRKICFNVEDETVVHKVQFRDLVKRPKLERLKTPWQKPFTSHHLTSPENQQKIREADKVARKKE